MAYAIDKSCVYPGLASDRLPGFERTDGSGDLAQTAASLRRSMLDDLRARIRRIERDASVTMREPVLPPLAREGRVGQPSHADHKAEDCSQHLEAKASHSPRLAGQETGPPWRLGTGEIDALLGPEGLEIGGVHEVKPAARERGASWAAAWAAAFVFSLALGIRRCGLDSARARGPILCCQPAALANELGRLYGPGLRTLGLAPDRLVIVETGNTVDTLWAMEEGLRSESLALVLGILDGVALTPARRLALAAAAHRSPCLLLTHPRTEATAATATRWRVGPHPSTPHPFDRLAPGALGFAVELERCRALPISAGTASFSLEWCDEALCFRLAPGVADRADAARRSRCGAR